MFVMKRNVPGKLKRDHKTGQEKVIIPNQSENGNVGWLNATTCRDVAC